VTAAALEEIRPNSPLIKYLGRVTMGVEKTSSRCRRALISAAALLALAGVPVAAAAIPKASDYHSLLVLPSDPNTLLLGTHTGLYRSTDGGRTC